MAKIVWGPIIILVIGLGIAIYAGRRPEAPPEEAVRPGLERVEEIIEQDERIKALPEEAVWPDKEEKVDRLVQEMRDESRGVRGSAATALGEIRDPRATIPLIVALKNEDSDVRNIAAEALGKIGKPVVKPLIAILKRGYLSGATVTPILAKIRDPRAVEPLIAALRDEDWNVQVSAAGALGSITKRPFDKDFKDPVRWQEWWEENREAFLKER